MNLSEAQSKNLWRISNFIFQIPSIEVLYLHFMLDTLHCQHSKMIIILEIIVTNIHIFKKIYENTFTFNIWYSFLWKLFSLFVLLESLDSNLKYMVKYPNNINQIVFVQHEWHVYLWVILSCHLHNRKIWRGFTKQIHMCPKFDWTQSWTWNWNLHGEKYE